MTDMKKLFFAIILFFVALSGYARSYERLAARMNDHFVHAEWREVLSAAQKMIELQPADVAPYSAALVASQFLNDVTSENHYLEMSQRNRVHIDSLLQHVYHRTKVIHNAHVYEGLLLNLKSNNKWLARVLNIYLLDFYAFARKTEETIAIADELLEVTPNSVRFKKIKADALFYQGNHEDAVKLYEAVLQADSANYDVITLLGVYYSRRDCMALAELDTLYVYDAQPVDSVYMARKRDIIDNRMARTVKLLQRAHELRPTDYLANEIARLQSITTDLPHNKTKKQK